ncbi:MAG: T9SS type A sorting domain-containing protein [Chitinophagales bacterium]|nr:T9SS type A sorting domain-containing protein [Chitinophagales bacterium]
MKSKIYIGLTVLLSALCMEGNAGTWENYSNVTSITDAEPFGDHIWASCKGGIIDFNTMTGEKTIFKKGDAGLPSSEIEQVAVDQINNTIWIGTYESGLAQWDGDSWVTYSYPEPFLLYRMKFDSYGNLWIQADAGLYKFDGITHDYTFINSVGGAGWDFNAWDFDITPDDHVLIFTGTSCMVIDAVTNTPIDSFPASESPVVLSCSPSTVRVYGINNNTYLIDNSGIMEFQFKDGTYASAMEGLPEFSFIGNLTRGTDNNIYAYVNGNAIYKLTDITWTLVQELDTYFYEKLLYADGSDFYLNEYAYMQAPSLLIVQETEIEEFATQAYNFNSNNIQGITKNDAGDIFMISAESIYTYNALDNNWDFYTEAPTAYGSMYDLKFANGNLYAVDYGDLIEYYDGSTWTHIPYAPGYSSIYIYDYHVTETGVIYFVNDEGLFKYEDGVTENLIETYDIDEWFLSVAYDAARDLVWLGRINGIIKYDFIDEELINGSDFPALAEGLSIQEIEIDENDNVWFGANNNKAYKFDGTEWADFTAGNDNDFVIEFGFDGTKTYFGLTGANGGVYMFDSADESWIYYHTSEDMTMASNTLNALLIDNTKNLWIAHTDAGASVYRTNEVPETIHDAFAEAITVYPNPATAMIILDQQFVNHARLEIVDLQGRTMLFENITSPVVDVENLSGGVYILYLTDQTTAKTYTGKLTIIE